MGVDGCIWVYMGALGYRGTSAQQNKVNREKNGQIAHVSCPYGRGNFPGHHVNGLWRVCMAWLDAGARGGQGNKVKKRSKYSHGTCFPMYDIAKKNIKLAGTGVTTIQDHGGNLYGN